MNYTTWIEINESNLNHNISKYKSWLPATTSIAAVIKANAYGHGLYEIASIHEKNKNISYLCVVNSHEALILRKQGICKPILILSYINSDIATIIANNIDITVYNLHDIILINETAQKLHKKVTIHLKVDTGMSRLGIEPKELDLYLKKIKSCKQLKLQSIWSHFSDGNNKEFVHEQELMFKQCQTESIDYHIANSLGSLHAKNKYNFARIGCGLYGYLATINKKEQASLLPVLSLKTKIIHIKKLSKGRSIGYQRTYTTTKPTTIAILAIGYEDGLDPRLSGKTVVIINGKYAPIISINMNLTTIDITEITDCKIHTVVTILGKSQDCQISVYDWQKILQKNIREYLTNLNPSLPRVIIK